MAHAIVIIGGLADNTDRDELLRALREKSGPEIEWDWIKASEKGNVPEKLFNGLRTKLTRKADLADRPRVVKLYCLDRRVQNQLYATKCGPVLVPKQIDSQDELIDWLFSAEANLIPRREWFANLAEAALVAILAKLIKNKSWNKDTRGHQWTTETDLLGQAPVTRPEFPLISEKAAGMLPRLLNKSLLLRKGGSQGKTSREWSINLTALPSVKQAVVDQSLAPLSAYQPISAFIVRISKDKMRPYRLDENVVSERIRQICRDLHG